MAISDMDDFKNVASQDVKATPGPQPGQFDKLTPDPNYDPYFAHNKKIADTKLRIKKDLAKEDRIFFDLQQKLEHVKQQSDTSTENKDLNDFFASKLHGILDSIQNANLAQLKLAQLRLQSLRGHAAHYLDDNTNRLFDDAQDKINREVKSRESASGKFKKNWENGTIIGGLAAVASGGNPLVGMAVKYLFKKKDEEKDRRTRAYIDQDNKQFLALQKQALEDKKKEDAEGKLPLDYKAPDPETIAAAEVGASGQAFKQRRKNNRSEMPDFSRMDDLERHRALKKPSYNALGWYDVGQERKKDNVDRNEELRQEMRNKKPGDPGFDFFNDPDLVDMSPRSPKPNENPSQMSSSSSGHGDSSAVVPILNRHTQLLTGIQKSLEENFKILTARDETKEDFDIEKEREKGSAGLGPAKYRPSFSFDEKKEPEKKSGGFVELAQEATGIKAAVEGFKWLGTALKPLAALVGVEGLAIGASLGALGFALYEVNKWYLDKSASNREQDAQDAKEFSEQHTAMGENPWESKPGLHVDPVKPDSTLDPESTQAKDNKIVQDEAHKRGHKLSPREEAQIKAGLEKNRKPKDTLVSAVQENDSSKIPQSVSPWAPLEPEFAPQGPKPGDTGLISPPTVQPKPFVAPPTVEPAPKPQTKVIDPGPALPITGMATVQSPDFSKILNKVKAPQKPSTPFVNAVIPNKPMKTSAAGIKFIKDHEGTGLPGLEFEPYPDPAGQTKLYSVGYGHQIKESEKSIYPLGKKITPQQADALLMADVKASEDFINNNLKVPISQNQFDALVDFGHSGLGFLDAAINGKSKAIKTDKNGKPILDKSGNKIPQHEVPGRMGINQGASDKIPDYMKSVNKVGNQEVGGLTDRRRQEAELYNTKNNVSMSELNHIEHPLKVSQNPRNTGATLMENTKKAQTVKEQIRASNSNPGANVINAPNNSQTTTIANNTTIAMPRSPRNMESTINRTNSLAFRG